MNLNRFNFLLSKAFWGSLIWDIIRIICGVIFRFFQKTNDSECLIVDVNRLSNRIFPLKFSFQIRTRHNDIFKIFCLRFLEKNSSCEFYITRLKKCILNHSHRSVGFFPHNHRWRIGSEWHHWNDCLDFVSKKFLNHFNSFCRENLFCRDSLCNRWFCFFRRFCWGNRTTIRICH